MHWRLDVIFREEASRIRKGNPPAIVTAIRHLALKLLEHEPAKLRLSQKRRTAPWNDGYRAQVLFGGIM